MEESRAKRALRGWKTVFWKMGGTPQEFLVFGSQFRSFFAVFEHNAG
jgi:hypothetical protein